MNRDFIQLKSIDGELKLSQKKYDYGLTVSTKELIFHKPHINYHIRLQNIISIALHKPKIGRAVEIQNEKPGMTELISLPASNEVYRVNVTEATMHNRSGITKLGSMQFIFPIQERILQIIVEHSGLNQLP